MTIDISPFHASSYNVETPIFEGPLDLLLHLIERAELDITKLALAQVTDQYLAYLEELDHYNLEDVSSFVVIAAKLLQIKSETLLPRFHSHEQSEDDPGEALARQLIIYKRFKEIAEYLGERDESGLHTYIRLTPPPQVRTLVDLNTLNISDLASTMTSILENLGEIDHRSSINTVVTPPKITIREKIKLISNHLQKQGKITFRGILGDKLTRIDIVVTFLAVLELVKHHFILAHQTGLFGEIEILPAESWIEGSDFELEFGE